MICQNCSANINAASVVCPACLCGLGEPVPDPRLARLQAECKAWRAHFQHGTKLELCVKPACADVDKHGDLNA